MKLQIESWLKRVEAAPSTEAGREAVTKRISQLTMPSRAMGRSLELVEELALATGGVPRCDEAHVLLFACEHGVTEEGVSAFPAAVTQQMVLNFIAGGAAINQLTKATQAGLTVVNVATVGDYPPHENLVDRPVASGTNNLLKESALDEEAMYKAILLGAELAQEKMDQGANLIACGEMGIGNTTVSACLTTVLTGCSVENAVGRGTGIDDETLKVKQDVVSRAINRVPVPEQALDILREWGGYELASIVGVILACAANRVPFVLDGYNVTAAAAVAHKLCSRCAEVMVASHQGAEPGHQILLDHLGKKAYLEWGLRLGEGSGAALMLPLCQASCDMVRGMATFEEAAVSQQ